MESKLHSKGLTAHLFSFPKCLQRSNPNPNQSGFEMTVYQRHSYRISLQNFFIFNIKK